MTFGRRKVPGATQLRPTAADDHPASMQAEAQTMMDTNILRLAS